MKLTVFICMILLPGLCPGGIAHIDDIPDFTQSRVQGPGHGNGQQYCAPAAVSNSMLWLSGRDINQRALVEKLASKPYMNTSLKNGTGTTGVLRGVEKIAGELFGGYTSLEYQGWRKHPSAYSSGVKIPDISRVAQSVSPLSAAWLNVGWYKYDRRNNEYRRIGGHWVTLAGATDNQLVIHDPAPRAGRSFANEFVSYEPIESGTLVGKKAGLPADARGYTRLLEGMHMKSSADVAIIDGVVYLEL